ncbi:hypothetical protein [Roseibium sp. RKSG952]|uniref:hypothetical protein n=1 Tax=Roseibium sp. RKSG952 TaxID=2529384 RepID=UPI0012BBB210|nr:hypothetical protein [Roseibium sp. RKSG952]MTI00601.1 hypothetical protein [Roseibium sp. RKSG952]
MVFRIATIQRRPIRPRKYTAALLTGLVLGATALGTSMTLPMPAAATDLMAPVGPKAVNPAPVGTPALGESASSASAPPRPAPPGPPEAGEPRLAEPGAPLQPDRAPLLEPGAPLPAGEVPPAAFEPGAPPPPPPE